MEAGCGLQGILSSTGQVQCGQVHCRLPYTAPPVHLKADMDGPLSNRGEKVNGARLGLVGQSHPVGMGFWQHFSSLSRHHASLPSMLRPPLCPRGSHLSRCQWVPCAQPSLQLSTGGWSSLFQIPEFSYFAQTLWLQRGLISHTTLPPTILLGPPTFSFLFLSVGSEYPELVRPRDSWSASDLGQLARSPLWDPGLWSAPALGLDTQKGA